jgi:hypothetical protein
MKVLNYSTTINTDKTIGEIQKILSQGGAKKILMEYEKGIPIEISFQLETTFGLTSYKLPASIEKFYEVMKRTKIPNRLKTREQAARVSWRVIKDWLEAQLAIVQASLVTMDQVFLPYLQCSTGKTLYQAIKDQDKNFMPAITDRGQPP